ncbi:hypothetical protein BECAL_01151 [Bellilinea caldifistulae]|nr:hypothetical protein BECAL_01151 [Bellilinea caldifistulae]GIV63612.1 MAG: hypothetical protein KatS3mg045_0951 [Bellilinea sp.]
MNNLLARVGYGSALASALLDYQEVENAISIL